MIARATVLILCVFALHGPTPAGAQGADGARDAYREGRYDEAIRALRDMKAGDDEWTESRRLLIRVLATVGRYDEAERVARQDAVTPGGELLVSLGQVLSLRGKRAEAESAYTAALAAGAADSLTASLGIALLLHERGDREGAMVRFRRFVDAYNSGAASMTAEDLVAVAVACRYLGAANPQLFKDALRAYDEAIARDPDNVDILALLGELFLEKYNAADAKRTFDEVLQRNPYHPRALIGEARRRLFDGAAGADSLVARALAVNEDDVNALLVRAELQISAEQDDAARRDVDRALRINPASVPALSLAATLRHRAGDAAGVAELERQVNALDPRDASFYVTLSDLAARTRRYSSAVDLARKATSIDSTNSRAHTHLGMNLLRVGNIAEGRRSLETAFARDPYDVWVKNTLDLLDTFGNYDEISSEHFLFMIEKPESRILAVYLADLGAKAHATFADRYGYRPSVPIRLELYRSHAEFSVRTVGLAGLGALGVSFGTTLAMDSPAAKDIGPNTWGSTFWHEVAHTFTLGASDHRVPRWLSEGLSVYEEHRARPGWGMRVSPAFLDAYVSGKLPSASRLNDGFVRPAYPQQVMFAYYQASLVCDFIAKEWGERAFIDMLRAYREGAGPNEVLRRVLRVDAGALDRRFDAYMRQRFGHAIDALRDSVPPMRGATPEQALSRAAASPRSWHAQMAAANAIFARRQPQMAIAPLQRAVALFPEYAGDAGPYPLLARAQLAAGDTTAAVATLRTILTLDESDLETHIVLADLAEKLGDTRSAADALDRSMYIQPYDPPRHERLATLFEKLGDKAGVLRERLAVVALDPVERAEAYYRLALAYRDTGNGAEARRSVLRALAEAPDFQAAQDLLLALRGATP